MFTTRDYNKCQQLFEKYYAGRKFFDGLYRDAIRQYLRPGGRLLDAGCGRYLKLCREFSGIAEVVGIDVETPLETDNQRAPFGACGDLGHLPFASDSFDMIISRSVVEHLAEPALVFREFCRVLRPGGRIVLVTPNKYDYVSLIAAITPYQVHRRFVSKLVGVTENDVFPTLYRANTLSALRNVAKTAGLDPRELKTINHYPAYLMFSPVLFRLGVLYERITNAGFLQSLRGVILAVLEKPGDPFARQGMSRQREMQGTAV